jgi:hypothetical protein
MLKLGSSSMQSSRKPDVGTLGPNPNPMHLPSDFPASLLGDYAAALFNCIRYSPLQNTLPQSPFWAPLPIDIIHSPTLAAAHTHDVSRLPSPFSSRRHLRSSCPNCDIRPSPRCSTIPQHPPKSSCIPAESPLNIRHVEGRQKCKGKGKQT